MGMFCSLILFPCMVLFASGVTGQQSIMDQQASQIIYNCSKGWSLPSILQTVLAVLTIILILAALWIFWRSYKRKQKDDFRLMEEGQPNEKIDHVQEENEPLQGEKKQLNEKIERLEGENKQQKETIGECCLLCGWLLVPRVPAGNGECSVSLGGACLPSSLKQRLLLASLSALGPPSPTVPSTGKPREKSWALANANAFPFFPVVLVCTEPLQGEKTEEKEKNAQLNEKIEFLKKQRHKVDVTLDPDTAHPRLEISDDGKSVKDTGTIRNVPKNEKRFDSHLYLLAKEGYTSGRHYWEVDVGKRSSWALGIACASVTRKGTLTLSPKNGFWVMGCTDGREYWAYTEPWTRLSVGGKLPKIGIFLDISSNQLSFYDVHKKEALYTFNVGDESSQKERFFPFFSTGPATAKPDEEPLKIVWVFDDE
ncbi:PREDICTED: butyrophilin subfamily 1 member A1-like [Calidris pugnax]|uniref:butyrophilin subfamily 1 member A1-like n=1 Tax=Calidris pugnax TaxID=198806 RepID=UPI00071C8E17|nr:PREDICTED: butyrophilin subfamily 1 member A1-like [Calidris pugnax]